MEEGTEGKEEKGLEVWKKKIWKREWKKAFKKVWEKVWKKKV